MSVLGPAQVGFVALSTTAVVLLAELKGLFDGGLVTQAEYDQRRQVIIDSV